MTLLVEEIVGGGEILKGIASLESEPVRDENATAKAKRFVPVTATCFVKAVVADSLLKGDPGRPPAKAKAIATK